MGQPGPRDRAFDAIVNVTSDEVAGEASGEVCKAASAVAADALAIARRSSSMKGIEVAFHGRLGRSPELRMSKAGRPFCTFSVVVAIGAEEAQWVQVVTFGEAVEALVGLPSGTFVYIEGHLRLDTYERKDGTLASALKVSASTAIALGQIGQRRRPAPPKRAAKNMDSQAPLGAAEHGGPNDPLGF